MFVLAGWVVQFMCLAGEWLLGCFVIDRHGQFASSRVVVFQVFGFMVQAIAGLAPTGFMAWVFCIYRFASVSFRFGQGLVCLWLVHGLKFWFFLLDSRQVVVFCSVRLLRLCAGFCCSRYGLTGVLVVKAWQACRGFCSFFWTVLCMNLSSFFLCLKFCIFVFLSILSKHKTWTLPLISLFLLSIVQLNIFNMIFPVLFCSEGAPSCWEMMI